MDPNEASGELAASRFGNFEVLTAPEGGLHLLGGGGFGKTYKARHVYLNQIVALKVINDRLLNDPTAKERFLREAQVVHQLRHPHIAHVLDFGEVKHSLYYAMEFCGGGNLEHMVSRVGPLSLPVALRCARQLAEALGCAHSHGFIHRDVKPANVMLTGTDDRNPQLKLVDFGLVKHLQGGGSDATAALTMTGQQFFTIQFASPEQLMEETLDARSDIFALGMTIWFLLKGSAPEGGSMASIVAKRLDSRSYESQLPTSLPAGYRAVLARLLEKDRTLRFQNTDEVLAALDAADAAPDLAPDESGAGASSAVASGAPPAELTSIAQHYTVVENLGSMPIGTLYRATSVDDNEQVAITMIDDLLCQDEAHRAVIDKNVTLLKAHPHETIARLYGLEEYIEGFALVQEWHRGVSLHRILKSAGFITYGEALRVLLPIAQGTDWTTRRNLPGVILSLDEIYLQPLDADEYPDLEILLDTPLRSWPPFRVRLLPYVIRAEAIQEAGLTINTEVAAEPAVAFSCLLYQLVAGHAPRAAAKLNKSSYVTIGRLAEESNRLLAACVANEQDFGGCEGILRALNGNEGVNFPPVAGRRTTELRLAKAVSNRAPAPVVAKEETRTGGAPGVLPPDAAKDAADARARQEAEAEGLRQRAAAEELARNQAGEARRQQQKADEERARQEAEVTRLKEEATAARLKQQQADAERARQDAVTARLKQQQEQDEERARQEAEDRRREEQAAADRAERVRAESEQARRIAEQKQVQDRRAEEERLRQQALAEGRAKQAADEAQRQKQAAEEAQRQKQAAEEAQLKRRQVEEERARLAAEEKRTQQRLADEEARAKQQAAAERSRQEAEEKQARQLAADEAAQQKQRDDDERAHRENEEKQARQLAAAQKIRQDDEERARLQADEHDRREAEEQRHQQEAAEKARLEKQRREDEVRALAAAAIVDVPPPLFAEVTSSPEPPVPALPATAGLESSVRAPGGSPPAIWIAGVLVVCAGAALLMLPFLSAPKPAASKGAAPAASASPTGPALTGEFVFAHGFAPVNAIVKIAGAVVQASTQDQKVVVPLAGVAAAASLSVEAPGFESQTFPLNQSLTVDTRVMLHRQLGAVALKLDHDGSDYVTISFQPLRPLPDQDAYVTRLRGQSRSWPLIPESKVSLPTGIYQVTLQGGTADAAIQPRVLDGQFAVAAEPGSIAVPPSLAGRYSFEFMFRPDANNAPIKVRRTLVIDPGLKTGHVDDIYPTDAPKDTKITDLSLSASGILHGCIRFSQRTDSGMGYDEQFDLSAGDQGFVIVGGGWEIPATDPEVARKLQNKLKDYQVHLARPDPQVVKKG